jgi:hypothetical protein
MLFCGKDKAVHINLTKSIIVLAQNNDFGQIYVFGATSDESNHRLLSEVFGATSDESNR